MNHKLSPLGEKIFLDRYALKDMTRDSLAIGQTVIAKFQQGKFEAREVATVTAIDKSGVTIETRDGDVKTVPVEHLDIPVETNVEQMFARVARGAASVEQTEEKKLEWENKFGWLLDGFKFTPGGRILAALGTEQNLSLYNCFVIPSPKDSRQGVMDCLSNMAEIMSRGGGVGINISSLRPRYAYVKGVNGRSSGSVSWGGLYSFVTGLIEQGGCLPYSALMSTDKGLIRAGDLADRLEAGEVIKAQTHQGLQPFTAVFRNGVKQTVRLVTERGIECVVSKDHEMAVLRDGKMVTEAAETLQPGDTLFSLLGEGSEGEYVRLKDAPQSVESSAKHVHVPAVFDEQLGYLVGYFQANGSKSGRDKGIRIAVPENRPEIKQQLQKIASNLFREEFKVYKGCGKVENLNNTSVNLFQWWNENKFTKTSETANVPEIVFQSPSSVQAAFFAGWFDADGCDRGAKGGYGIDSISRDAVNGLQNLLAHNGILSKLSWTVRPQENWQDIARLSVTGALFKNRLSAWMCPWSLKDKKIPTKRTEIVYPSEMIRDFGIRPKYYTNVWPGFPSPAISYSALSTIHQTLLIAQQYDQASKVEELLRTVPDTLRSIEVIDAAEVVDFEVKGTHMLCSNGLYSKNSRRGALMEILCDWHPDLLEFITAKKTAGIMTNANISVGVSDKFMQAVENDADWELVFPDTNSPNYDELWDGNLNKWLESGGTVVVHKTVKAREIWNEIITSAWASAEPGIFFIDRANQQSNSYYYEMGDLIATNPCHRGDTVVATTQGPKAFKELADAGQDVEVWSYNFETKRVEAKMMRNPHLTQKSAPIMETKFSNGVVSYATYDHHFMNVKGEKVTVTDCLKTMDVDDPTGCIEAAIMQERGVHTCEVVATVMSVDKNLPDADVYNGMVEDNHNYYILSPNGNAVLSANCGEQPLPAWSVCNLGHINLAQFVDSSRLGGMFICKEELRKAVRYATRFLDNVIDATPYFSEGNKTQQLGERRVGLGTIGLAEMLIRLEVAYGSDESLKIINDIYQLIAEESYLTSAQIAAEKGAFPWCNNDLLCGSKFIQSLPVHVQNAVEEHGLRNVTLLTQAPTGTVGTMIGTSTGIEPFYFWSYFRKGRLGVHEERVNVYQEWVDANPDKDPQTEKPDYFVNAMDLAPEGHVKVQAAIQRWVDSAISKTCNVPSTYTVEETRKLYELMHKLGCKGGTIYRDKSRDEQVLNLDKPEEPTKINSDVPSVDSKAVVKEVGHKLRPRPYKRFGATVSKLTPGGTAHVTMNDDEDGNPFEVFVDIGKGGSDIKAMAEGLGRLCSLILRLGSGLTAQEKVEEIISQLSGIGGQRSIGFGSNRVKSLPDALAQALEEHYGGEVFEANDGILGDYFAEKKVAADLCPGCGDVSLVQIEGCCSCPGCGHSEC